MPPLDLLDSVTAGHMTNASPSPSPERGPATNRHDGPPDTPLPAYERQDDAPIANDYPAPPPSPPAYRLIPHRPFFFHNNGRRACVRWLRLVYLDILLLLTVVASVKVMMVFSDNVYRWDERYFPMTWDPDSKKWYGPPELSYPHSPLIFSVVFLAVLLPAVGAAVVIGMQLWVRSFWDANAGLFGLFKGLVLMTFFQIFLKQWIGELRPYFITVCNPYLPEPPSPQNLKPDSNDPSPYRKYITPKGCTTKGNDLLLAMQSFPSGHTAESFFVGTFLALYLNAKLKGFSDYHTGFWKLLAVMLPLFGACYIAGTLVIDRNHHVHDILLSAPWGVLVAFLAYRSHYASVFNYRTNHLPLPWSGSRQSLRPTIPAPETGHGDNLTAVTWPRKPVEHSFDGNSQQATGLGLDGAADRLRRPRNISRGRLRQNVFPPPVPLMEDRTGAIVPNSEGEFELRDAVEVDRFTTRRNVSAAEPSTARATGHELDLEGQRQRRWTLESGEEMG